MRIACLHAAQSNIAVFEAAAAELGVPPGALLHVVRPDLLAATEKAGALTAQIASETAAVLKGLSNDADAVLLTCSALGPAVAALASPVRERIVRVDAALAQDAFKQAGKVVVLCATEATISPTTQLFEAAASRTGASLDVRLVPGAWAAFKSADTQAYFSLLAEAADAAYAEGAGIVALAQASMAPAAVLVTAGPRPLTSPASGLAAGLALGPRENEIEQRLVDLEVKASFAEDLLDQLSKTVFQQQRQLDWLMREVADLRQQSSDAGAGLARNLRDELPPHY